MNQIILAAIFLFSGAAFASNDPLTHQLIPVEDSVANVAINLNFGADRPLVEAVHMDLAALCKDQSVSAPQVVMSDEKICAFHNYEFDEESKVLSLYFSTGEVKDEVTSCENHWKQEVDLKEICGGASVEDVAWRGHISRRGLRRRVRVRNAPAPYGQFTPQTNAATSIFGGIFGGFPEQQPQVEQRHLSPSSPYQEVRPPRGLRYGRGGYPHNGRGEVVRCPGLGGSECLSAIIAAESGCNAGVRHAGHGIGLCAIENDGRRLRFGPACANIGSVAGQLRCCAAMVAQGGLSYFGPRTRRIAGGVCGR